MILQLLIIIFLGEATEKEDEKRPVAAASNLLSNISTKFLPMPQLEDGFKTAGAPVSADTVFIVETQKRFHNFDIYNIFPAVQQSSGQSAPSTPANEPTKSGGVCPENSDADASADDSVRRNSHTIYPEQQQQHQ